MNKLLRKIIVCLVILMMIITLFIISLYILIKNKVLFINDWIIDESSETIGVDISSYQADVDIDKLKKQGIEFMYIKATEGSSHRDQYFMQNWENSKSFGIIAGAYHFFSYDSSGINQAHNFINTVGEDIKGRLIPAVDVEYYGDKELNRPRKADVIKELKDFLDEIERVYGVKAIIYTRPSINKKYLKGYFDEYKKWMTSIDIPLMWSYKDDWYIWQYSNRKLKGYNGEEEYIDLNVLNNKKNLEDLIVK